MLALKEYIRAVSDHTEEEENEVHHCAMRVIAEVVQLCRLAVVVQA